MGSLVNRQVVQVVIMSHERQLRYGGIGTRPQRGKEEEAVAGPKTPHSKWWTGEGAGPPFSHRDRSVIQTIWR